MNCCDSCGFRTLFLPLRVYAGSTVLFSEVRLCLCEYLHVCGVPSSALWMELIFPFHYDPFHKYQIWAKSWWSTHCFSYRLEGLELMVSSPGSEHIVTYQTRDTFLWRSGNWNKGHIFRLLEWAVYWAKDWGLRVLHWLPSNFYLTLMIYLWLISLWVSK